MLNITTIKCIFVVKFFYSAPCYWGFYFKLLGVLGENVQKIYESFKMEKHEEKEREACKRE